MQGYDLCAGLTQNEACVLQIETYDRQYNRWVKRGKIGPEPEPNFDFCDTDATTDWTRVYKVMIGVFAAMLAGIMFICCTCVYWPLWWVGYLVLDCVCIGQLGAIILLGMRRFNDNGEKCAAHLEPIIYNDDGDTFTFEEHGNILMGMFITGCILYFCNNCFIYFMMENAKILIVLRKTMDKFS